MAYDTQHSEGNRKPIINQKIAVFFFKMPLGFICIIKFNPKAFFMTIVSEPANNGLYFQQNIPDIVLAQNNASTYVLFEFKQGSNVIIYERYDYDAAGKIHIRNIFEIVEKWFNTDSSILLPGTTNIASNLAIPFTYTITEAATTHTVAYTAIKCDAEMTVDATQWTAKNFLTRCFREKRTAKARTEYLSFLMLASYSTVTINYKIVFLLNDVATEATGTLGTIAQQTNYKVATFNASIYRVMMAAGLNNLYTILQYDIWLTGTGLTTNFYSFMVDNQHYRNNSSFVFINCFGVLESFTATGVIDTKKEMEYNLANIDGHYRKITQDFYAEHQCYTGFQYEEEMDWLDDFIKSFAVLRYYPDTTLNTEITLISVDKQDTNANELQAFIFNYRKAKNIHLAFANAAKNISEYTFDQTFE
jgi:hypothetical protein